ncbi:amidase [Roseovarius sp. S4756]|uniref:amidase n=1 Tax=Roseovarius maritimus TaxID=3342637 RepID=UPI003726D9FB
MPSDFDVVEATITDAQAAFRSGDLTVHDLVSAYLERIEEIDKSGPELNSVITINSQALEEAKALDSHFAETGDFKGPLHGVPVLVKDQAETKGIKTTFGSIAQDGYMPEEDATAITKLKDAGAIILGKTALPDFATSWFGICSKIGSTKNPYVLSRDPGGSSSGTGAAIAASLAMVGIGEDTGGSIRIPAGFCNLVGVRVTPGLISRKGMSPLVVFQDTAGPMARTVRDAALLLDSMVGYDPEDEYTVAATIANHTGSYTDAMDPDSMSGAKLGVVRNTFGDGSDYDTAQVNAVVEAAFDKLKAAGATLVDIEIPDLSDHILETSLYNSHSRHDINKFLASRPNMPVGSLEEIQDKELFHPNLDLLKGIFEGPDHPEDDPDYFKKLAARDGFQRLVVNLMAEQDIEALIFPIVQLLSPTKEEVFADKYQVLTYPTNTLIASQTWMPSIALPAGFAENDVPVGVELVVRPYGERELFRLGAGFEKVVAARRPPEFKE